MGSLTPEDRGYIAGLIDGEGCIFIAKNPPTSRGVSHMYSLNMQVGNTDLPVLEWLKQRVGGRIGGPYRRVEQRRPIYMWCASKRVTIAVLTEVRSLMQIKAVQAWLALEFAAQCSPQNGRVRSASETALREGYFLAMRWANHREI